MPPTARRADLVVFTDFGAHDVESRLREPRDRSDVAGRGFGMQHRASNIDVQETRVRFGLGPWSVVLSVAAEKPHENLLRLIGVMRIACLPEVDGAAAALVHPPSEEAIAGVVVRVLNDDFRRAKLMAAGHERCPHFSWDRCAQGVMAPLTAAWAAKRGNDVRPGSRGAAPRRRRRR